MRRQVTPEILDELPADDPDAIRSRRDLRRINALMANFAWMRRSLRQLPSESRRSFLEVGSGDGGFLNRIHRDFETSTGIDLAPRPETLDPTIQWEQGDVFELLQTGPDPRHSVLAANLFLHHFEDDQLRLLGNHAREFGALLISEPWRSRIALAEGFLIYPFVNGVTRHDMIVSIRAGFIPGELPELLGLGPDWQVREEISLLGACRLLAWRTP